MKKLLIVVLLVALIATVFIPTTLAGADTVPTNIAGRIILVNPGAQLALQTGNINYLLTGKTDGMRNCVGRTASVYGVVYDAQGMCCIDVYSYRILQ